MKVLKFLIGRAALTALIVLLQIAFLLYSIFSLTGLFFQFYVFFEILSLFVVFHIIRKPGDPQTKLPWILLVFVVQPFGSVIYAMFHSNNPRRKHLKVARLISAQHSFETITTKQVKEELKKNDERAFGQANYLEKMGQSPTFKNTKLKYYESGELFFEALLEELKKAKKFVFMEYFIIDRGIMWNEIYSVLKEKAKQGVEVLIMYDDIGSIYKLPYRFDVKNSLENLTLIKFNKFRPVVSAVHNNRDHRKITVIDGKVGFTGGINIADEYINKKVLFGHWKDNAIMLKGPAVDSLTNEFLKLCMLNGKEFPNTQKYFPLHKEENQQGFVHPIFDGPYPLYKDKVGENAYINIINQATKYVYITTPYLIIGYGFLEALKLAAKRGVDVKIITPYIPDKKIIFIQTRSYYKQLLEAGVKIFEYLPGFMHAKTLVSDDKFAIVGTFNLDYRSFVHHFENGVWIFDDPVISQIKKDVEETVDVSKPIQIGNYKFGFFSKLVSDILAVFSSLL